MNSNKKEKCLKILNSFFDVGKKIFNIFLNLFVSIIKIFIFIIRNIRALIIVLIVLIIIICITEHQYHESREKRREESIWYLNQGLNLYNPCRWIEDKVPIKDLLGFDYVTTKDQDKIQRAIKFLEKSLECNGWRKNFHEYYSVKCLMASMYSKLDGIENKATAIELFERMGWIWKEGIAGSFDYMKRTADAYEEFGDYEKAIELNTKVLNQAKEDGLFHITSKYGMRNNKLKSKLKKNKNVSYAEYKAQKEGEEKEKANEVYKEYVAKLGFWGKIKNNIIQAVRHVICIFFDYLENLVS